MTYYKALNRLLRITCLAFLRLFQMHCLQLLLFSRAQKEQSMTCQIQSVVCMIITFAHRLNHQRELYQALSVCL
uniref:hypothetical protein n=1 Tax=Streptococcus oralis TaxID=1303 RepID=UPI0037431409